jgi:UDP-galactopyranose mutase
LRWDFVYQRPQHLLSRCALKRRVFFVEEAVFGNGSLSLEVNESARNLYVVVPRLPDGLRSEVATTAVLKEMIHRMIRDYQIRDYICWDYTPMALDFTRGLTPAAIVYDCMDPSRDIGVHRTRQADVTMALSKDSIAATAKPYSTCSCFKL